MKKATFPSTSKVPIRIPPGCNTGLSHNYILDGKKASEVNIFEIKLSVCALTQFTMTKYYRAVQISWSVNSGEEIIPGCQEIVVPLC